MTESYDVNFRNQSQYIKNSNQSQALKTRCLHYKDGWTEKVRRNKALFAVHLA